MLNEDWGSMANHSFFALLSSYSLPLLFAVLVIILTRNKFKPGLRDIPGPPLAAYTNLWRLYDVWKGQAHWTAIAIHKKYGKLVRIGPNAVSVADPAMVPVIYNTKGDFTKTAFYPLQSIIWHKKPQMNLFSTRDETEHRKSKKMVATAYSLDALLKMEHAMDDCSKLFLQRMGEYADRGEAVDLGKWLQFYAFDVVGELSFEKKLGFLEQGKDVDGMMKAMEVILSYAATCGQVPEAHTFLLGNPLLPKLVPQMESMNQTLMLTLDFINKRTKVSKDGELELQEGRAGNDMLSKWAAVEAHHPLKMDTRDMVLALTTNVFAGGDTTAIALRAILYFLMKNPEKMQKLRSEIDDADKAGKLSYPVSEKEARTDLPYLNAVEKEAMRLHPSVGLLYERHTPPGAIICGRSLPAGTIVGINPWPLHYDAEVFPNPAAFEPERWLETDSNKEQLARMERSFFSFGAGSRMCLGRNISIIEMRKLIPQFLREFDVSMKGDKEWKVKNAWFTGQQMPPCLLKRRKQ